jgi:Zn finger protein HypA/HybF involved in hydrogenase expression
MVTPLHKTLEQELNALLRGASLECLACGEFVLRSGRTVSCPECGSHLRDARNAAEAGVEFGVQAG